LKIACLPDDVVVESAERLSGLASLKRTPEAPTARQVQNFIGVLLFEHCLAADADVKTLATRTPPFLDTDEEKV